jgi:ABC-type multidrug transport system ATPase subunit
MLQNGIFNIVKISYKYPKTEAYVFNDIIHSFNKKDMVGIYGSNGSGKTTFLNCISGILKPTSGKIILNGKDIDKRKNDIAVITDNSILFPYLTLQDNISFFMAFHKKTFSIEERDELIIKYDLTKHINKYIHASSKGMIKKTQIVIALLMKPSIIIADEPFDGLDEQSQLFLMEDLFNQSNNHGTICVFSDHNLEKLKKNTTKIIYF